MSADKALHARFLRGLELSPGKAAVRAGRESVTYEEAHERALRWAGALLAGSSGESAPRAVGVLAAKSVDAYVGLLAALYAGAAAVPLNPGFPAARTRYMLQTSAVSAVLADEQGLAALADGAAPGTDLPVLPLGGASVPHGHRAIGTGPRGTLDAPRPAGSDDTAYMLFTSGSTGRPKGVRITHGNLHHYFQLLDRRYDFHQDDVFSQTFDLNFDCAMFDVFNAWGAGATVQAVPAQAYSDMPSFFAGHDISVWFSTPSAIPLIRRMSGLGPGSLPTLRWSLFAGEALKAADAVDWQSAAPGSTLENIYGPTELTVTITGHRWSPQDSPARCVNGLVPIGAVNEGHDHLLLDGNGDPVRGEGELCVTGPQMVPGYLDPADEQGRFHPYDGRTWYRTGDRVRTLDNGELIYLGRLDNQVQIQGWRVELSEVEHALRAAEGVTEAVAVTRASGNGLELVVYYTGSPTAPSVLARELRQTLPQGMLPREYRHLDELPLNSNRKIDRGKLAAACATGTPMAETAVV
ncbi:AMP-binding protein [Streptomyces sp. NBC_01306]|uniref:AMP-binding protein n=1 Tax=Streptomyces sp. NBC_01306 TaxID=2903819 RepID=UPI00224F282B|nr:AMP-binding protein [Streptomyces sp. NBC_01306]MCX4723205.1 AMP-binding protein [Streptomyces sp. NBC_01306]